MVVKRVIVRIRTVAILLAGIVLLSLGITALTCPRENRADEDFSVVAATYPMYTAALQVVGDVSGVSVACLTQPTAGCTHDYQLSPSEMKLLSAADVLVRNGMGADDFLERAVDVQSHLTEIDVSEGLEAIASHGHHSHEEEHDHEEEVNEHLWVSPSRYAQQIENLRDGLCKADPSHAAEYTANASDYLAKIRAIHARFVQVGTALSADGAVLFHDSVAYAAQEMDIPALAVLPLGEEQGISAGELAEAVQAAKGKRVLLLYDSQYTTQDVSAEMKDSHVISVIFNTAVMPCQGIDDRDTWLAAMEENLKRLEAAV